MTHPAIVGKYGRCQTNSNGELLLDIAQRYNLTIANTLFKYKVAHRITWTCRAKHSFSGEKHNIIRNQIDYILIRQHHKLHVNGCRAYSGTGIDSDHKLVIAAVKEKLSKLKHKSTNLIKTNIQSNPSQHSIELYQKEIHKLYKNSHDFSTKNTQSKWTNLMNILTTAAKVTNKHSNSQFDNEIKKLSDKQKNIKNNLNAINFKEGNQESEYRKLQKEGNLVVRQLRQKLKEEKAKHIEQKNKNIEQLTSNPTKMYRAIQDIDKNKKPLLTLCSKKGLTTNEEKTTETLAHYFAKMFTRITQQQMPEPIPMSEPITWKEIYEASLKFSINKCPDNNGLQAEHIKYAPKCVHQDIANLLFEVAETGTYPQELEHGLIIPIQKPGKQKGKVESIRPVILLSIL